MPGLIRSEGQRRYEGTWEGRVMEELIHSEEQRYYEGKVRGHKGLVVIRGGEGVERTREPVAVLAGGIERLLVTRGGRGCACIREPVAV